MAEIVTSISLRAAAYSKITDTSNANVVLLLAALGNGVKSIVASGRLEETTIKPAIVIQHGGEAGVESSPFSVEVLRFFVHSDGTRPDWVRIDKIIFYLRSILDGAILLTENYGVFSTSWTRYTSPDRYDDVTRTFLRETRFNTTTVKVPQGV